MRLSTKKTALFLLLCVICLSLTGASTSPPISTLSSNKKIPLRFIESLTRNALIQEPSDVTGVMDILRVVTVDLTGDEIQQLFEARCLFEPFQPQPHSILRGSWLCGDVPILELMRPLNDDHWQEFGLRTQGRVGWAGSLEPAGWIGRNLLGSVYSGSVFPDAQAQPSMVVARGYIDGVDFLKTRMSTSSAFRVYLSATVTVRDQLETFVLRRAVKSAIDRAYRRGRDVAVKEHQKQVQTLQHEHQLEVVKLQSAVRDDPRIAKLLDLLTCPLSSDKPEPFRDPVINRVSGRTYEREAITRKIKQRPVDPKTGQATVLDDLAPNRLVKDAIAVLNNRPA